MEFSLQCPLMCGPLLGSKYLMAFNFPQRMFGLFVFEETGIFERGTLYTSCLLEAFYSAAAAIIIQNTYYLDHLAALCAWKYYAS